MWDSVKEYSGKVLGRWLAYVPGVVGGIEWALGHLFSFPQLPTWFWLALFGGGFVVAGFLAFHDVRDQRDEAIKRTQAEELATFTILGRPRWSVVAYPYNLETGGLYQNPESQQYRGDPELRLFIAGDVDAMAHGGTNGGYLYDIKWSVRDLPDGFDASLPAIPQGGIGLQPLQSAPFKQTVTVGADKMHYSMALRALKGSPSDMVLVASYRRKGSGETAQSELVMPRGDLLLALNNWSKQYPELTG